MRNFKRFLTLALAVLMVVSVFTFGASAAKFTDVDEDNEALAKAVNLLAYVGVTKGTSETTFGTDDLVTREQMAAFIYRLMKKGNSVEGGVNQSPFTDLEDETFFFMISWANTQNIIKGTSATTFNPKGSITLQDAYTMLVRALGYEKEEALPYPFGYIEVAEGEGVELDEGLDSSVGYTDELTRGDVAILLYNTFFAETGVAETKQVEKLLGEGSGHETYVLVTETTYPTFCEKYFDVLELEYQAVATPNYVFAGQTETTKSLGYDAVMFDYVGDPADQGDAPAQFYAAVEDLGVENADDYIMSHFTMYITLDEDDAVEEILYAEPLMKVKTTNNIKLETLPGTTAGQYYGDNVANAKNLSGKAVVDGEAVYFYNAPYTYAKPQYATGMSDEAKYAARNAENPVFITREVFTGNGNDVEDGEYQWTLGTGIASDSSDDTFEAASVALIAKLTQVYVGGPYEADFYDVDGDGLYDYIDYKPYSFAIIDTDEEKEYEFHNTPMVDNVLYTEGVVMEGVEVADEDFVIAYLDADANYVKVVEVVEPVEANIVDIAANKGTITLSNDAKVDVKNGWKLDNFLPSALSLQALGYVVEDYDWTTFNSLLSATAYDADNAEFYIYNGVLLAQDGITTRVVLDKNLAVITADEDGNTFVQGAFNAAVGGAAEYAYAWIDGELKYVVLDTDADILPDIDANGASYINKLATYTVDKNGVYTFKMVGDAYDKDEYNDGDADDGYIGIEKTDATVLADEDDDSLQFYGEVANGYLVKNVGKRFQIRDTAALAGNKLVSYDLTVSADTKIIIRNEYVANGETVIKWYTLGAEDLTETLTNELTNIQYVVANNPDYTTREDLLVLFAQVNGAKLRFAGATSTKSERIVKMVVVKKNADGEYYNQYTLLNPYTGETEEGVIGSDVFLSSGAVTGFGFADVVTMVGANVDEDEAAAGNLVANGNANANVYWIVDYDAESDFIEIANIPADGDDTALTTYRVSIDDAALTTIGGQAALFNQDMVKWYSLTTISASKLDGSDKTLKAVNKAYAANATDKLKTVYAKYLKAYIDVEWENDGDHTALDENNMNGVVNFAVVIANDGEAGEFCKLN